MFLSCRFFYSAILNTFLFFQGVVISLSISVVMLFKSNVCIVRLDTTNGSIGLLFLKIAPIILKICSMPEST